MRPVILVTAAIVFVWQRRVQFAKSLSIPVVAVGFLDQISTSLENAFVVIITSCALLLVHTVLAVTTHRLVLIGPNSVVSSKLQTWSPRETSFLRALILMSLLASPSMLLLSVPGIGVFFMMAVAALVMSRLSLVFPSIAIDSPMTFKKSWELTEAHQGGMFVVVFAFPFTIGLLLRLIGAVPYLSGITVLLSPVTTVLTVAALSLAYREIFTQPKMGGSRGSEHLEIKKCE